MANDGWASDYLRQLNTQGPGNPGNVVSSKVQYVSPVSRGGQGSDWADTSDIPLAPGQNPEDSVYSNASGARMGQTKPASGYRAPAGGGWDVNSSDTNLRFSNESGARRYARPKRTQSRSRGSAPANGVKTRSAPLSGSDVTAAVVKAVKADGNTSFASWRQSLVNQGWDGDPSKIKYDPSTGKFVDTGGGANGVKTRSAPLSGTDVTADVLRNVKAAGNTSFANWRQSLVNQGWSQAEADAVRYDPSTGKFMSNASGQAATDHHMREQADKDAGIMADNPEVEGKVSGQTPAKTEGSAQPAPAKTEGGAQPAPAKTEGSAQPAPANDHEQEVKAAVDEFLKQHPADGKERLKSIYAAVDSQNIKDDAAYNLAVLAEIQKAQTPAKTDTQTPAPVPGRSFIITENTGDNHVPVFPGAQPAPANDHEQEVKAAVDEFLKQHPADGKERLKSIYGAVDSQNIKDDAAYNLAVLAEIQKASAASGDTSDVDSLLNNPGNTGAADSGKAVLLERQAQTESGVNDYQDQIREGINWLRMFHAPDDPAGVRAEAVITAIGNMVRSSDPERYKHAVEELEKQKSYVIAANNEQIANDITEGSKVLWGDPEKAAEYVRQLRAANAAKAQAAAEAAEQRSDNPEGWL